MIIGHSFCSSANGEMHPSATMEPGVKLDMTIDLFCRILSLYDW